MGPLCLSGSFSSTLLETSGLLSSSASGIAAGDISITGSQGAGLIALFPLLLAPSLASWCKRSAILGHSSCQRSLHTILRSPGRHPRACVPNACQHLLGELRPPVCWRFLLSQSRWASLVAERPDTATEIIVFPGRPGAVPPGRSPPAKKMSGRGRRKSVRNDASLIGSNSTYHRNF